jgi:acetyltransferase-like isoleucine patch superfamily enzyme
MLGWNEEIKKQLKYCGTDVHIGHNVMIANPSNVVLGDRVRIDPFTLITTKLNVGSNVHITAYSMLGGGSEHTITLGDWTFIGYGSKLFCASEDYGGEYGPVNEYWGNNRIFRGDITFKDYSGIASDVIMMPGCTLPEGCTIGAKSFVYETKNLLSWSVWIGSPLKFHKVRNKDKVIALANNPEFRKSHEDIHQ